MSMMEPLMPHGQREQTIAAADPGTGAPPTAAGFGVEGEEPDLGQDRPAGSESSGSGGTTSEDTPFRTPDPADVRRAP